MKVGGLFEGYGGLTTAARAVFGGELAWVSEYEPPSKGTPRPTQAAARLLAHRHPDVPNLGDITAIDWPSVEQVDVLCGGFPCQDVSSAGKRVGLKPDSRSGLWEHFARAIAVLRPSLILIENVRGLLSAEAACDVEPCPWCLGDRRERPLRALGAVLGDLAALGYDAQWTCVGADAVGAPHQRARVFVLAWPAGTDPTQLGRRATRRDDRVRAAGLVAESAADAERVRLGARRATGSSEEASGEPCGDVAGRGEPPAADSDGVEPERRGVGGVVDGSPRPEPQEGLQRERAGHAARDGGAVAPDAPRVGDQNQPISSDAQGQSVGPVPGSGARDRAGRTSPGVHELGRDASELAWGPYEPAIARWERVLGRHAPVPTQTGKRGGQQLSPRFVEWLMGLPEGWVTDVPGLTRNEQLKLLGNGVVPQQAEHALRLLLAQLAAVEAVAS